MRTVNAVSCAGIVFLSKVLSSQPAPGAGRRGSVQAKLTDEQWQDLITPDTPSHKRWERYIDTAAQYLKQLQEANIPVLWRPYHEHNGNWFWWAGERAIPGSPRSTG